MSKTRVVQSITDNGNAFGQISHPNDIMKSQEFAHRHADQITLDFLTLGGQPDIAGLIATIAAGLSVSISAGRIYFDGYQYEGAPTPIALQPANSSDRIDLIVARIAADNPVEQTFTPFQRLRTPQELTNNVPPYPPQQFQVALERHNVVTVSVKTGVPAANPVQPALASGEIALWAIRVPANAAALVTANLTDVRRHAVNLRDLQTVQTQTQQQITVIQQGLITALDYEHKQVDFSGSFGRADNILGILLEIAEKLAVLKYRYPTIVSVDGRCPAMPTVDPNGKPCVDIPVGTAVQFGDGFMVILPANFQDASVNARFAIAGENNYNDPLLNDLTMDDGAPNNAVNVVRFDAPDTTKWLYMNRAGQLFFRTTAQPSNAFEVLLMKITPNGSSEAPRLKRYINLRNGLIKQSGVATASAVSRNFEYEVATPPGVGYLTLYGVRASDKTLYELPSPGNIAFDQTVAITGIAEGDTWVVERLTLSGF